MGEFMIVIKLFTKFFKFAIAILWILLTLVLFGVPVIVGLYLFPSLLIIQGVYLSIFAFRKKKLDLQIATIIFTSLLTIIFIGFGIWINPTLNYLFNGLGNVLSSMFLIEIKFLPLFVVLYFGFDWSIYLLYRKVSNWYEYRKANYIFVNRFIEVWIWLLIVLKSYSMLDYLMNTRKSILQLKIQWRKENVLLNDKNAFIWTIEGNNEYQPFISNNHIVLADKIMSLFDFTEPHYQAMAHEYLLILIETLLKKKIKISLENIVKYFSIKQLQSLTKKSSLEYDYLSDLEVKNVNGLQARINVYFQQLKNSIGLKNNLLEITKNHKVILFSLNSLTYPQLASNMGKLLIQDLKEFASIKPREHHINLLLDEFNVFASDNIINLINKTRSFNYQCFLCFQTINDLKTNNKDLTDTIFGNTANIIAHSVKDPNSAEYLAKVFGTIKTVKLTRQLDFLNRTRNMGSVRTCLESFRK